MSGIYGVYLPAMQAVMKELERRIDGIRKDMKEKMGMDPVEHCLARIKSEESMREKCRRRSLPETSESALEQIHDAIGIRIVCAFVDDVYAIRDAIAAFPDSEVVEEKDYIRHVKPNGYRSYHLIIRFHCEQMNDLGGNPGRPYYYTEFQLRTISQDTWAALEHHLKYKKQVDGNTKLIVAELKRCADELASTDISMQAIRDMILGGSGQDS